MLSLGDGVALAGLCGVVVTVLVIWNKKTSEVETEPTLRRSTDNYISKDTCEAIQRDIMRQLSDLKKGNSKLFSKMDGLDKFIRENSALTKIEM